MARPDKKLPLVKTPKAAAAAASSQEDKQGKEWNSPYEWLAAFNIKGVKKRWTHSLASMGFCLICHRNGDKHSPVNCPLLAELNLKLVLPLLLHLLRRPLDMSPRPPLLLGGTPWLLTELLLLVRLALVRLVATVPDKDYDSGDDFCWEGNDYGVGFTGPSAVGRNSNNNVALYPSCLHAVVKATPHFLVSQDSPSMCPESCAPSLPSISSSRCLVLSRTLSSIIARMSAASILLGET